MGNKCYKKLNISDTINKLRDLELITTKKIAK